jgi:hypothetical protein
LHASSHGMMVVERMVARKGRGITRVRRVVLRD